MKVPGCIWLSQDWVSTERSGIKINIYYQLSVRIRLYFQFFSNKLDSTYLILLTMKKHLPRVVIIIRSKSPVLLTSYKC